MNARTRLLLVVTIGCIGLAGCAPMETTARTRAANDFKCPEDKIVVTNIGGTSYRASGCDREATYNCVQSVSNSNAGNNIGAGLNQNQIACVREEQHVTEKASDPAPPTPTD